MGRKQASRSGEERREAEGQLQGARRQAQPPCAPCRGSAPAGARRGGRAKRSRPADPATARAGTPTAIAFSGILLVSTPTRRELKKG